MYEQVKRRLWAVSQDTCPPSLSSATPLFFELELAESPIVSSIVDRESGR